MTLVRLLFIGSGVLAVCAVLAAFASGSLETSVEGAGGVTHSDGDVFSPLGEPEFTPDPSPEPEFTPEDGGACCPDFEPTEEPTAEPEPTDAPPDPEPTSPPAATATPSGGAGAGGIGPPDTGSGPAAGTGPLMLFATLLAVAAAVLGGAGVLLTKRAD